MKRHYCKACSMIEHGVKTRVAIPHTCGKEPRIKMFEQFVFESTFNVLHGTKSPKFDKFRVGYDPANGVYGTDSPDNGIGVFFTDNNTMAEFFAGLTHFDPEKGKYVSKSGKGRVMDVTISIDKPYVIDDKHKDYDADNDMDSVQIYFDEIKDAGGADKYKASLEKRGYDGIILKKCTTNYYGKGTYTVYVVFDPRNTKINEGKSNIYYNHWDKRWTMKDFIKYFVDDLGLFSEREVSNWYEKYDLNDESEVVWVSVSPMSNNTKGMSVDYYSGTNDVPNADISSIFVDGEDGYVIPEISDGANSCLFVVKQK